jgi:hypothetical protein
MTSTADTKSKVLAIFPNLPSFVADNPTAGRRLEAILGAVRAHTHPSSSSSSSPPNVHSAEHAEAEAKLMALRQINDAIGVVLNAPESVEWGGIMVRAKDVLHAIMEE